MSRERMLGTFMREVAPWLLFLLGCAIIARAWRVL
jgi:hypothetical protein